jgi:flagellar FliL protein
MATADNTLPQNTAPVAKAPLMTMIVCCLVTVLLAVAGAVGAMIYLSRHGTLSARAAVTEPPKKAKAVAVTRHSVVLDPMLVNLADIDGHAYLRIGIVLAEADDPNAKVKEDAKPVAGENAAVRDTIFDVLGRENSAALLAPDGKEKLKAELMSAIGERNADLRVKEIYFTDFLVQR